MKRHLLKISLFCAASISTLGAFAQTYSFSNCGSTGQYGPTQGACDATYGAGVVTVATQGIQQWVVPSSGVWRIVAIGASGGEGQGSYYPGLPGTGAQIEGDFILSAGTILNIVVGQKGEYGDNGSGGGGGSFVFTGSPGGAGLLVAAGGGGGHGHGSGSYATGAHGGGGSATSSTITSPFPGTGNGGDQGAGYGGNAGTGACNYGGLGAGGTGWYSSGAAPIGCGMSTGGDYMTFVGGAGGDGCIGGFGGGGGADGSGTPGGGGGGYTGGGGGNDFNGSTWGSGQGAGSFNGGTNQINLDGVSGAMSGYNHGSVTITSMCSPTMITTDQASLSDVISICEVSSLTAPTATNDCGATVSGTPDVSLPITTIGNTLVTWTFDDGSGNTTTQTQNVILTGLNTTITAAGSTIEVAELVAAYQWLDCDNGYAPIAGAVNQFYTATATGNYAVEVTKNGCVDTSACFMVDLTALGELSTSVLNIYPNPSNTGSFEISYDGVITDVKIFDLMGREISVKVDLEAKSVNTTGLSEGQYVVKIAAEDKVATRSLVVTK